MAKNQLQFATLNVKFGNADLLDYAVSVVLPAFFNDHEREVKGARYFFKHQKLVELPDDRTAIVFDFIKDTTIARERVIDKHGALVDDFLEEPAALTGRAVLILDNHRLLYCGTTADAPGLESLKSTIGNFVRAEHFRYIQRLLEERKPKHGEKGKLRLTLFEEHPTPTVELVPLTSTTEIAKALAAYKVIRRVSLRVIKQNTEVNDDYFIEKLHEQHLATKSETTRLVHTGNLNKGAVTKELEAAGAQGGAEIAVSGTDHNDNRLDTTNDGLSPKVRLDDVPDDVRATARLFTSHFDRLTTAGVLKIPRTAAAVRAKVKAAVDAWKKA